MNNNTTTTVSPPSPPQIFTGCSYGSASRRLISSREKYKAQGNYRCLKYHFTNGISPIFLLVAILPTSSLLRWRNRLQRNWSQYHFFPLRSLIQILCPPIETNLSVILEMMRWILRSIELQKALIYWIYLLKFRPDAYTYLYVFLMYPHTFIPCLFFGIFLHILFAAYKQPFSYDRPPSITPSPCMARYLHLRLGLDPAS